ncbi:GPP34-domain-containing protein [Fistulina hepatica ATCC 64428]|uniref:GPP34-domain-containing protein n=1 Tax=Fistulina hepatica ATCC 64428 TaxID=1128425 RepID=A0A0D7ANU3_9AGAR|nr:GPP34-domain-containing protein [Fistulina hepatica ATCC 64428]
MSTAGLSRRRVAGAVPASPGGSIDGHTPESDSASTVHHAGSAFAGGNKIAYDPRDLEEAGEEARIGGKMPHLTLMEEVVLLGLKDKQGYLSFWNDNISYALRGCILIELALRRRIAVVRDPSRKRYPLTERLVEVIDDRQTGETILDETLRLMKSQERDPLGINTWVDLLSGETWNVLKIGFQLKQVRERLAKGLVDKGVLRTEKRNFLLFDMATHPIADVRAKENLILRIVSLLCATTSTVPPQALHKEGTQCRVLRVVCLACAAYTASVLDNALERLGYEEREDAFTRCDSILQEFSTWPFGSSSGVPKRQPTAARIATGSSNGSGRESILGMIAEVKKESLASRPRSASEPDPSSADEDLGFELIAGVLEVLSKLDSLL